MPVRKKLPVLPLPLNNIKYQKIDLQSITFTINKILKKDVILRCI